MPRSRPKPKSRTELRKVVAHNPAEPAPLPEAGTVILKPKTIKTPAPRSPKAGPLPPKPTIQGKGESGKAEKDSGLENLPLDVLPLGVLIRSLEREIRVNGPHTDFARQLDSAIRKAREVEPPDHDPTEHELILKAAADRWPIMPSDRRKVVRTTIRALRSNDENVQLRAVRTLAGLDRINQRDDHRDEDQGKGPVINVNINTTDAQRSRLDAIAARLGVNPMVGPIREANTSGDPEPIEANSHSNS